MCSALVHVVWSQNLLWPNGDCGESSVTHSQIYDQVKASAALFESHASDPAAAEDLGLVRDTSERVLGLLSPNNFGDQDE